VHCLILWEFIARVRKFAVQLVVVKMLFQSCWVFSSLVENNGWQFQDYSCLVFTEKEEHFFEWHESEQMMTGYFMDDLSLWHLLPRQRFICIHSDMSSLSQRAPHRCPNWLWHQAVWSMQGLNVFKCFQTLYITSRCLWLKHQPLFPPTHPHPSEAMNY